MQKLQLHGFNNLTKSLSFCIYDICYATTAQDCDEYIAYIDEQYNATRLSAILSETCEIIGANILNIATQDYDPQGASVTILMSEGDLPLHQPMTTASSVALHLDKSHICVHTYPEIHPHKGICTFRADIEVSTCGLISPLNALNYLIQQLESDIVTIDYRVRGFTRKVDGKKLYIDHALTSIQNFISDEIKVRYQIMDVNMYQENIFHTKMMLNQFNLKDYLFAKTPDALSTQEEKIITAQLLHEMQEIYYGKNMEQYR